MFAHAMETLKLEIGIVRLCGKLGHARERMRIVCRERREKAVRTLEQKPRTRQVVDVRIALADEDWVVAQSQLLSAFDLGVPISTLHQSNVYSRTVLLRQTPQILDESKSPPLIRLHCDAESRPSSQF